MSSKSIRADRSGRCAITLILMLLVSCGDSAPSTPSSPYVGNWSGTLTDSSAGDGTWEIMLSERTRLSGVGAMTVGGAATSGTVAELPPPPGSTGRYLNFSCGSSGSLLLHVTVAGNTISGTYDSFGCGGYSSGTMRGQRQ